MKKLSLKAKKIIIYVVTLALIVALISGVILSLGVVRAGANDNEKVNLLNSVIYIDESDIVTEPYEGEIVTPYSTRAILDVTNETWAGELTTYNNAQFSRTYFPDFKVTPTNIPNIGGYSTNFCVYIGFVFSSNVSNITQATFSTSYITEEDGYQSNSGLSYYTYFGAGENICIVALPTMGNTQSVRTFYTPSIYMLNSVVGYVDYEFGSVGTSAVEVIQNCIEYRDGVSAPHVFGTEEFTIVDQTDTQQRYVANLSPVWDPFYAGFVGRVATADGTSVPVMYTWTIDGLNATNGNVVVLDPAYHDYITELSLNTHVSNGSLELLVDKTMDVRYIAISDDIDLLSEDLVNKANRLQLIQNQINQAYSDGFLEGLDIGSKQALAGVFGNAQMNFALYVYNPVTGVESPLIYNVPINVANGGMDLSPIWELWYDSTLNDGTNQLSWVQVSISFDNGVLWSNDLLYFKFNTPVTANQMPYDAYLLTVENSSQNYNVSFVERNGLWYWQTSASLDGYSVSDISFKINSQHISIYDFLDGYNTTLNNNIQTFGTNQASYDRGFDDGFIDGVDEGFSDGIAQSSQVSWMEGHSAGYDEGRNVGYNVGYEDGLRDDYRFYDLFFSLFDAELNVFKSIVSFEIFGVNVAGFVLGLVSIGVVAFVIRKVW